MAREDSRVHRQTERFNLATDSTARERFARETGEETATDSHNHYSTTTPSNTPAIIHKYARPSPRRLKNANGEFQIEKDRLFE